MKKQHQKTGMFLGKLPGTIFILLTGAFLLFSFTIKTLTGDFLKQLGISKTDADEKIINSILGGSLDQYGVRNAKNIAVGNRAAVTKDLFLYTKTYVGSPAFIKAYNELRQREKPEVRVMQTPEAMHKELIERSKKAVADVEASAQKADATMKPMFEKMVVDAKKQLKEAEDPNNKMIANYRKNYPQGLKDMEKVNQKLLADWESKYPGNHLLFVKMRMQQFLDETKDIDFNAQLIEKNGKKYFVNKAYESKGNRWKMAFRAGKDAVETARTFVQQWINEIH
jgi:vacuolar-type H+-ATPase subunit E/Vma4